MVGAFVCISAMPTNSSVVGKRTSVRSGSFQRPVQGNSSWIKRLYLTKKLEEHRGCVNTIQWNAEGNLLVTGSDDCKLVSFLLSVGAKLLVLTYSRQNIWSAGPRYKLLRSLSTGHSRNIFCAKFVPFTGDTRLVSCGMDGEIRCSELNTRDPNGFLV